MKNAGVAVILDSVIFETTPWRVFSKPDRLAKNQVEKLMRVFERIVPCVEVLPRK